MGSRKLRKIRMKVGPEPYCLPEAVADTWSELAEILGVHQSVIFNTLYRSKKGEQKKKTYITVTVEDDEEEGEHYV